MTTAADFVTIARFLTLTPGREYTAQVQVNTAVNAPVVKLTAAGAESAPTARRGVWETLEVTFTATADTRVRIVPQTDADGLVLVDGLIVSDDPHAYFDGYSGVDAQWLGTPDGSVSQLTDRTMQAYPEYDDPRGPHIILSADIVPDSLATVTVTRSIVGADTVVVPGVERIPARAGFIVRDWYAPLNTPIVYTARMYDVNGVVIGQLPVTRTQLDVIPGTTWISSPSNPNRAVQVSLAATAGETLTEMNTGQVHQIGRQRILITADTGNQLDDLNMDFYTDTLAQYRAAVAVFREDHGAVVIRTTPPMEVPRTLYFWSPKPVRMEWNLSAGFEEFDWANVGTEVSAPTSQVVAPVITHRRYADAFPTGRALANAYPTWRDALLNPPAER